MKTLDTTVLIVGAGPVGLATALDLGWRGVPCIIIDNEPSRARAVTAHPRAAAVTPRTMEFLRRWGIAEQVREAGFPKDFPPNIVFCTSLDGPTLMVQEFASINDRPALKESPEIRQRCPQMWFDPILERALAAHSSVTMHRPWQLDRFEDRGSHVEAFVTDLASGEQRSVHSAFLVAADGPRSGVRQQLGIATKGSGVLSYSVNVVLELPRFQDQHDKGPAERYMLMDRRGVYASLTCIDGRKRWRLGFQGSEAALDLASFDLPAFIRRSLGPDVDYEIVAVAPWKRLDAVAERFQQGRVFIAGDAAHTIPPNLGMGMNTGVGDAVDLGWKLDATIAGWGGPRLLASYTVERRPVAVYTSETSTQAFRRWMTPTADHHDLLAPGAKGETARARVSAFMQASIPDGWDTLGLQLGYRYEGSPICIPDGTDAPEQERLGDYIPTARPGSRAPHAWLKDGRSTLDLFGRGFVMLDFGAAPAQVSAIEVAAAQRGVPLRVERIADADIATLYGAGDVAATGSRLVLVRPDGHVAWRPDPTSPDTAASIDRIRGA